jgi:A nuclease of the HNH/ENDO VII superfamily with conserved LHH
MFEDLIPSPRAEASAPPTGMFDDLIPAGGARGAATGGMFADLGPGVGEDIVRSVPYGVAAAWAGLVSDVMKGIAAERDQLGVGEPGEIEQAPSAADSLAGLEQVTGPLYRPHSRGGRLSVAAAGAAANPLSYLGPGSLFAKFVGAVTSGLGSELAREAAEGTDFENVASFGGGLAGGLIPGYATGLMERLRVVPRAPVVAQRAEPPLSPERTTPVPSGPREGAASSALLAAPSREPTAVDAAAAGRSGAQQSSPRGSPESVTDSLSIATRDLLSEQQIAENRAKIIGFLTRVGVPPDRVGPTEIDAVARRMGTLAQSDTVERAGLRSSLERGVVSRDEVDFIYGPGAADEVRGTSAPANVQVDPPQGRTSGQPAPHDAEGQPLPRFGEGVGETGTALPPRSTDERPPIAANREYESGDVPSGPTGESARPSERPSTSRRGSAEPVGPAETVRPAGVDRNSARASDSSNHSPGEDVARNTGPPQERSQLPENGAPSGAVSASGQREPPLGRTLSAEQPKPATANPINSEAAPQNTIAAQKLPGHRLWYLPRRRGQAPIGDDGHPIELHHVGQEHGGGLIEMTRTEHRGLENFTANHHNTGQKASLIDRWRAGRERYKYWAEEWDKHYKDKSNPRFENLRKLSEAEWKQLRPPRPEGIWSRPQPPDSRERKY